MKPTTSLLAIILAAVTSTSASIISPRQIAPECLILDPTTTCEYPTCPPGYKLESDFVCPVGAMCCPIDVVFKCCPIPSTTGP
ncbi:hypothetical protein JAAARDRAFT_30016 [Jaapia argillacea MUCL 33604]|uniref:Granulins domain-containing protein n=1 Tax=Jaapia argillacea MUCL 33604 TaxID=933084 RepID=A0A067Q4Y1_9AGAM|nr:hypothetical protein JAAARDRAFT_30016 [Jaapia argillacea MUCL 33604]